MESTRSGARTHYGVATVIAPAGSLDCCVVGGAWNPVVCGVRYGRAKKKEE